MTPEAPDTRYARRGTEHVAYQVWEGTGPPLLEFPHGTMISFDEVADEPHWWHYTTRLAAWARLIRFDYLGLGLSDPLAPGVAPTTEGMVHDAVAVLDAVGVEQAAVLAAGGGTMPALVLAATVPERVRSLVLVNGTARIEWAEDYPVGIPAEITALASRPEEDPNPEFSDAEILVPSLAPRPAFRTWWSRAARRGASPATSLGFNVLLFSEDVRDQVSGVRCPTVVVSRRDTFGGLAAHGRWLAEHIAGAPFVSLPGADILPYGGDVDELADVVEEAVTGRPPSRRARRALATLLFTDIVGSTELAALWGDRRWRSTLDELDRTARRLVARHDGVHVKDTGDGLLARFDYPAGAIAAAVELRAAAADLDLELRAGLHTGEVELRGDDLGGIAVHIAARVADLAGSGEILVTGTVRDLLAGSEVEFTDRGTPALKGVPGEWRVFAVVGA